MHINCKVLLPLILVALLLLGISAVALAGTQNLQSAPETAEIESNDGESESPASASEVKLTQDEAVAIAEAQVGSTAVYVELERENGVAKYSVELKNGAEVEVDAYTGAILETEGAGGDGD
jgi:uncharacterized membrane protein YkoI